MRKKNYLNSDMLLNFLRVKMIKKKEKIKQD